MRKISRSLLPYLPDLLKLSTARLERTATGKLERLAPPTTLDSQFRSQCE